MKKALITYNTLFLILGNVLFSNLHHHDHQHDHDYGSNHSDCEECLIIENSNYIEDCDELNLPINNFSKFISEFISTFEWLIEKTYLSRAPPPIS